MKLLKNAFFAIMLVLPVFVFSKGVYADGYNPFQNYTSVISYPLLQENQPVSYTVPSTQFTGQIVEVEFWPWKSGAWNLRVWNQSFWDYGDDLGNPPAGAAVEYAWKDINNGNTWNVWKTTVIVFPFWEDTYLFSGSPSIAYRIRMASLDDAGERLQISATPQ